MNNVKLIFFKGCPEADKVREALLKAGILDFEMIPQDDLPKGHSYLKLSSPSVISGDELIYGIRTSGELSSCTFDAINTVDEKKLVLRFKELKE